MRSPRSDGERASPAALTGLNPEAVKVYDSATRVAEPGSEAVTVRLPTLVFRTAHQQGGTYHLAYIHAHERLKGPAFLHVVVLYPDSSSPVVYEFAQTDAGRELTVEAITQDCAEGYHTERFLIHIPDDVLTQHVASGARIKFGHAPGSTQLLLDLPRAHIEALLALRFPDGLPHVPPAVNDTIDLDRPAFESARNTQHELPEVEAAVRDPPFRATASRARRGPWVILGALAIFTVAIVWRFAFHTELQSVQNQPQQVTTRDLKTATAPSASSSLAAESPSADSPGGVRGFVEAWFARVSGSDSMDDAMSFYAPRVDYYQRGVVPKMVVQSDKAQALRRWPVQNNQIEGEITVTQAQDETRATFLFSYWLENGRQIRNGRARVLLSLQQRDGRYYIVRENTIALDAAGNATNAEFYWRHGSSY
ncbi:MAG: hypothetical protein V4637_05635 [Pseudomonadota bacterium]